MSITDKTRKLLWARSGNRCAYCHQRLIEPAQGADDPSVVGDECHIVSKAQDGPRYDPSFLGDHDDCCNLLLLCKRDHKMVDDQEATFPAEKLKRLKGHHEVRVDNAVATQFTGQHADPASPRSLDNFRTMVFFVPDQQESVLEAFQQRLISDPGFHAYGKVATGFKSNATGRYAAWVQAFLPVSGELLKRIAGELGVGVVDISHERLPDVGQPG
jgi:hypothetical protein